MVSVGVSALERIDLHVIDPGVKINGQYYLVQKLLPDIRVIKYFQGRFHFPAAAVWGGHICIGGARIPDDIMHD